MTVPDWLACPNRPGCGHAGLFHDIAEPDDPWPTCCVDGCRCGQPPLFTARRWPAESVAVQVGDLLKTRRTPHVPDDLPSLADIIRAEADRAHLAAYAPAPIADLPELAAYVQANVDRLRAALPAVHVTPAVPQGTVVVVEPPQATGPQTARRTLAMHPADADRICREQPLLALELGLL